MHNWRIYIRARVRVQFKNYDTDDFFGHATTNHQNGRLVKDMGDVGVRLIASGSIGRSHLASS